MIDCKYNKIWKFHSSIGRFTPAAKLLDIKLDEVEFNTIFGKQFYPIRHSIFFHYLKNHFEDFFWK